MGRVEPAPISINDAMAKLTFLPARTPTTSAADSQDAFALLGDYRNGGIFVGHWAGSSEWERHDAGDEIVMVLEGRTTIFFFNPDDDRSANLVAGQLVVVPEGTWHRFETPESVKILSVTPQPTEHSSARPS